MVGGVSEVVFAWCPKCEEMSESYWVGCLGCGGDRCLGEWGKGVGTEWGE